MSIIENYPALRPSLLFDFANSGRVDPRIQCVRASTATCFGADSRLRTVANNVPRINYDPATGKCLGLRVDEARTNLWWYSNAPGSASSITSERGWAYSQTTQGEAQTVDGLPFTRFYETAAFGGHMGRRHMPEGYAAGTTFAARWLLSAGSRQIVTVLLQALDYISSVHINLATGDYSPGNSNANAVWSVKKLTKSVVEVVLIWTAVSATTTSAYMDVRLSDATSLSGLPSTGSSYLGSTAQYVLLGATQLEVGAFPTSLIPTTSSAVTRAAESLSLPQLTLIAPYAVVCESDDARGVLWQVGPTSANRVFVESRPSDSALRAIASVDGNTQYGSSFAGKPTKSVLAYRDGQYIFGRAETDLAKSVSGLLTPNVTGLFIGSSGSQASQLNGHIRRLAIYSGALTDQQIQRLRA